MRTIFYSRAHPRDHAAAVAALREAAAAVDAEQVQNPVTHALGTLALSQGDDKEQVIASVSAQVADHDAEIASMRKTLAALVSIISHGLPAPTTTVVPPGNPFLSSNALHTSVTGSPFSHNFGLPSSETDTFNALSSAFDNWKKKK